MKTKKTLAFVLSVLLAACSTPSDHVSKGPTAEYDSSNTPSKIAGCVARNADEFANRYSGHVRETGVQGEPVEVVVRAGENVFAVVHISPSTSGSHIKVFFRAWTAPIFPKLDGLTVEQRLTKGCI